MQGSPIVSEHGQVADFSAILTHLQTVFRSGKTRELAWRRAQLKALNLLLTENEQTLRHALFEDLGKSASEAWSSEIGFVRTDIRYTLKHLSAWNKPKKVSTPLLAQPGRSYRIAEPKGTVLIIGAWNYPLQLILCPCIAALAAGNCMVLKPSELAKHTSSLLASLLPNYVDSSAVVVVEGGKDETSALLSLKWDHIFYTGGAKVGKIVLQAAAQHLTPVTLELGGKSPCIVDRQTNVKVTARRIVWGKWMNAGQTCIAPDYVLVEQTIAPTLVAELKRELAAQYDSDVLANPDYGKIINTRHLQRLQGYIQQAEVLHGGQIDMEACKLAPTIIAANDPDALVMQEEIFGPVLPIVTVESVEQAVDYINARPKPLALYLFTNSLSVERLVLNQTSAGSVCVNDVMMFMINPSLPFGGVGESGMGSYHGRAGFETFSHSKSVMRRSFMLDIPVRYPPFNQWKLKILQKIL